MIVSPFAEQYGIQHQLHYILDALTGRRLLQAVAAEEDDEEDLIDEPRNDAYGQRQAGYGRQQQPATHSNAAGFSNPSAYNHVAGYSAAGYGNAAAYPHASYPVQDDFDLAQRAALGLRVRPRKVCIKQYTTFSSMCSTQLM